MPTPDKNINKTTGGQTSQGKNQTTIPKGLLDTVNNFRQFQERILEIARTYNMSDQLCSAFGETVNVGNGGMPLWYSRIWLFNGNHTIADVTGPTLDQAVNRAIEDCVHYLAMQSSSKNARNVA